MRNCIATLALSAVTATAFGAPAADTPQELPHELPLYAGKLVPAGHITVADFNGSQPFTGSNKLVSKPQADMPDSVVIARTAEPAALSLSWKNAWYASLRLAVDAPLDLRAYVAEGTLDFDIKVSDMADGGISVAMECGAGCTRRINYLRGARALAGQGWQHLSFAMSCFVRDGADFGAIKQPFAIDASGTGEIAVANVKFKRIGKPNASCPDYRTESVTPAMLDQSWSINWWLPRHQKKLAEIQALKAAHQHSELVFIGDSITEHWETDGKDVWARHYAKVHALNLGFGGDHTENVLWRIEHGELDGISPKVAVLMVGTNNTGDRQEDPRTTAAGVKRILDEIRQRLPRTKVLLLAVFPRDEKPDSPLRGINNQLSQITAGFADQRHVFFLDINEHLLAPDGTLSRDLMPDLLHPNAKGYAIWAEQMAPMLQQLLTAPSPK